MQNSNLKNIVVIYHGNCRDGFGGAFAAWKKFADTASYIPRKTQEALPDGLVGKKIFIIDYSYSYETLEKLRSANESVVVLDHHKTAEATVSAFAENVFDLSHSGAVLAWNYFHPSTPVPTLLHYIEDHDLWKFTLPDTRAFGAALGEYDTDFSTWDTLIRELEHTEFRDRFIEHGKTIANFEDSLVEDIFAFRERALFEGNEMYVLNASRVYRSILGHKLATLNETEGGIACGIVYYRYGGGVHVSLRSNGDFDVGALAGKYGGGGHKNAASIRVADFNTLPFTFLPSPSHDS